VLKEEKRMPQGGQMKSGTLGCLATSGVSFGLVSVRLGKKKPLEARAFWMADGSAARYSLGD
jgi:hypothetical protein